MNGNREDQNKKKCKNFLSKLNMLTLKLYHKVILAIREKRNKMKINKKTVGKKL